MCTADFAVPIERELRDRPICRARQARACARRAPCQTLGERAPACEARTLSAFVCLCTCTCPRVRKPRACLAGVGAHLVDRGRVQRANVELLVRPAYDSAQSTARHTRRTTTAADRGSGGGGGRASLFWRVC